MSALMTRIQHELDAIAAENGLTYVGLTRHTLDSGRKFYSVNLHAGHMCRAANGATLAGALAKAIDAEPRYFGPEREAA